MMTYKTVMINGEEVTYAVSGPNPFADFGEPDANEEFIRSKLANCAIIEIDERGLSRRQAAKLLGVPKTHIRWLQACHLDRFSLESLFRMVAKLGVDVTLSCRRRAPGEEGELRIYLPQDLEEQEQAKAQQTSSPEVEKQLPEEGSEQTALCHANSHGSPHPRPSFARRVAASKQPLISIYKVLEESSSRQNGHTVMKKSHLNGASISPAVMTNSSEEAHALS